MVVKIIPFRIPVFLLLYILQLAYAEADSARANMMLSAAIMGQGAGATFLKEEGGKAEVNPVGLTPEEQAWISENPVITVAIHDGWSPYQFAAAGKAQGYTADLVRRITHKLGMSPKFVVDDSLERLIEQGHQGEIDLFPAVSQLNAPEDFYVLGEPYLDISYGLVTRVDKVFSKLDQDTDGVFASVSGDGISDSLKALYPKVDFVEARTLHEALQMVAFGQADALVGATLPVRDLLKQYSMSGLKLMDHGALRERFSRHLHFAVRRDLPILATIMQKSLAQLTIHDKKALSEKWLESANIAIPASEVIGIRWWLIAIIGLLFVTLFLFAARWSKVFVQQKRIHSFTSKHVRKPFICVVSLVVVLVALLIHITLAQNKKQVLASVEVNLGVTLKNTVERLDSWASDRLGHLHRLADNDEFVALSRLLLGERHDTVSLQATLARVKMTDFLVSRQADWSRGDIYVINRQRISVLAPLGDDIGKPNFIAQLRPELINQALSGKAVFIPFVPSDVAGMGGSRGKDGPLNPIEQKNSMSFFAVPVKDNFGDVIAVLAQSLSTDDAFMRILRHGRIGTRGESYALDGNGRLLSESRFRDRLVGLGLVDANKHESNHVEIRDPGDDLMQGYGSMTTRSNQPLTQMAEAVIRGSKQNIGQHHSPLTINVTGYRNYLGVPVFGAWIWDFKLGVGIATEIDVEEAMLGHRWLSMGLISTAFVLMALFAFGIFFTLNLGDRVMVALRQSRDDLETRVKERTRQLGESELKYRSLFDLSEDAIVTVVNGQFVDCNQAAVAMFDYESKEALLAVDPLELSPEYQHDGKNSKIAARKYYQIAAQNGSYLGEWTSKRKNGELFDTEILLTYITLASQPLFLATIRDIRERKKLESEQQRLLEQASEINLAKSEFLANMSHEIRTPMNAIVGLGHLLSKSTLTDKQGGYVKKIQSASRSLLGIIDDILDFSKIEAGQLRIEKIDFSLDDVLGNLATMATTRIAERPIEFIYNISPGVPQRLMGDPLRLGQILTNLVTNAIKFTEKGEIILRVTEEHEDDFYTIKFEVEDMGIGISKDYLAQLFEPFTQADGSTTRRYGGTGLGLSICKQLCELMGGSIHASSELGKGSRFYFYLPFRIGKIVHLPKPEPDLRGMKVLLVDDNKTAITILSETLSSLSFNVDMAYSGPEALEKLDKNIAYDLLLIDWQMPGMDGMETIRRIKDEVRNHHPMPVVMMMTAYGREAKEKELDLSILDGFLVKPVTPSQLFDAIIQVKHGGQALPACAESVTPESEKHLFGHVLLVEDNQINQQVALEVLQNIGLSVDVCDNGEQAVNRVKANLPDLVLMDIQMPKMDGYEATREIRKLSGASSLPIYAMTANAMKGDEIKSLNAGMNGHITKPVDPEELYRVLQKHLSQGKGSVEKYTGHSKDGSENRQFPGLDIDLGIKRVAGNAPLFNRLLGDFFDSYKDSMQQLDQYLASHDIESAYRLSHTLCSVSANIGAEPLSMSARAIENKLRDQKTIEKRDKENITEDFDELFRSIEAYLHGEPPENPSTTIKEQASLSDLLDALFSGDPQSKIIFEHAQHALKQVAAEPTISALKRDIDEYEFDAAANTLRQVMEVKM